MDSNSTQSHLVGWQLDNDNRSAWDILWACASTIFACTWTVIHAGVPNRDASNLRRITMFLRTWLMTLLVPEATFGFAWLQLMKARESKKRFNVAEINKSDGSKPDATPKKKLPEKTPDDEETEKWSLAQAFCINAGGLALRTKDEWVYPVSSDEEMVALIKSGLVQTSDFSDQEIESRAKADSFAKLFTIFQVTWFLCNVIARWGYHLPVSPLEVATVSYVFLAVLTYLTWWYKPKDVSAPILGILPCDRQTLEENFHGIIDPRQWIPLRNQAKKESRLKTIISSLTSPIFVLDPPQEGEVVRKMQVEGVSFASLASVVIYSTAGMAYSGIHLAAWDFKFPTRAEWLAWIILSFIAIGVVSIFTTIDFVMAALDYLREWGRLPSFMATLYDESHWKRTLNIQLVPKMVASYTYVLARLGVIALVCASFRALPEGSYTTVDWVTSIPHF